LLDAFSQYKSVLVDSKTIVQFSALDRELSSTTVVDRGISTYGPSPIRLRGRTGGA
jgi:hypothetical protein